LRRGGRDRPRGFCCIRRLALGASSASGLGGNAMSECFRFRSHGPGANCRRRDIGRQAVEAAAFVARAPLFELSAGNIDVDRGRPAFADDGGAVNQAPGDPLSDAPLRDVAHLGKF
jgi:hypothetical protein